MEQNIIKRSDERENLINFLLFENQGGCIGLREFCDRFGYSIKTVYDWKHRPRRYGAPRDLFLKFNREVFVRLEVLRSWVLAQNPDFPVGGKR